MKYRTDYSREVTGTFTKFQQGPAEDRHSVFDAPKQMNNIEAKVLDFVALLDPEIFSWLDAFCLQNGDRAGNALPINGPRTARGGPSRFDYVAKRVRERLLST